MLRLRTKPSDTPLVKNQFLQWPVRAYIICHLWLCHASHHSHTHSALWLDLHHFASATPASLLFLKHAKCTLASGPLHLILPLPRYMEGMAHILISFLSSFIPSLPGTLIHTTPYPQYLLLLDIDVSYLYIYWLPVLHTIMSAPWGQEFGFVHSHVSNSLVRSNTFTYLLNEWRSEG